MQSKKYMSFISLILLVTLLVSGCSSAQAAKPSAMEYTDGLGRTVSLSNTPETIISMAPSNTEILYAIGAGKQLVARDEFSDFPEEAMSLPSIGGSMGKYSLEQIAALKPDLVLAAEINTPEQIKSLEEINITVYYLANPTTLDEMYTNLEIVAKLTGHENETAKLITDLKKRVDVVLSASKPGQPVKVFYELDGSDIAKPWTVGKGTFADYLITLAGAENIGAAAGDGWLQMSQEAILAADPGIIILGDSVYGVTAESVAARPGWSAITAVKNNKILPFDDDLMSVPGPRLVDGLEEIYKIVNQ